MASSNKVEIEIAARNTAGPVIQGVAADMQAIAPAADKAQGASDGALDSMHRRGVKASEAAKSISDQLALVQRAYVALQATQGLQAMAADLATTADAYNNLQARIKLATGEGAAFDSAFEQVSAVAQRTSSSIESTGTLFAKLADAGKSAGMGTKEAIAQALSLTETVNQAVQLGGASAGASDAAITQLIQGLQGGVLRGDEFNSVMEQSPRLARALADGLGVTTGELRKMAEAGQLSSDTVIKALKDQADTVAGEFSKLPPTVGRALQNLSTSWTLYVGETDKATGASKVAATVIGGLANNLSTIASYLVDAGQAATAFAALKLAQHFTGIATAATSSATAVAANTVAMTAAGTAGSTAAVSVGRFATILSGLKTFTLLGLITNFHDIGTAIGEGAAKLMGFKDRTEELTRAEKAAAKMAADAAEQRTRMEAATQGAIDKQFELSKASTTAIAEFDKLTKAGSTSAEAVAKIGKDFDLSTVPGIRDATAVLDKLAADGKVSAGEFQKAWADALKGQDLAAFETRALAAFAGTAREAERLAQILDASLREAIRRTGLDFEVISGGMGKASVSAINDTEAMIKGLDRLKAMGVDTAQALTASIGKGIDTADSQKALDAVKQQIEAVRRVLGDKVADGLLDQAAQKARELKDALDKATPGITSLREAMKELGVTSDQTFKDTAAKSAAAYQAMKDSGTASIRELQDGFKKYAESAIAANAGVATEALKSEAAMRGLQITTDSTGKAIVGAMGSGKQATEAFTGSVNAATTALGQQNSMLRQMADAAENLRKITSAPNNGVIKSVLTKDDMKAVDNTGLFGLQQKQQSGTLGKDDLATAEGAFKAATANLDVYQKNATVFSLEGARSITDSYNAARAILERVQALAGPSSSRTGGQTTQQATTPATTTPKSEQDVIRDYMTAAGLTYTPGMSSNDAKSAVAAKQQADEAAKSGPAQKPLAGYPSSHDNPSPSNSTYTVNINLDGKTTSVNVASDSDAKKMQALIAEIARAKLSA